MNNLKVVRQALYSLYTECSWTTQDRGYALRKKHLRGTLGLNKGTILSSFESRKLKGQRGVEGKVFTDTFQAFFTV